MWMWKFIMNDLSLGTEKHHDFNMILIGNAEFLMSRKLNHISNNNI